MNARIFSAFLFVIMSGALFAEKYDLVLLNGRVIDPETKLDAVRHVAIDDGKIVAISEEVIEGAQSLDVSGMVVAPGFIDIHAHGMNLGDMRMQAMQGVTTILELESGVLPIAPWYDIMEAQQTPLNYGASAGWTYSRIENFSGKKAEPTLEYFQAAQGATDWKLDVAEPLLLGEILGSVEQGLKEGALGIGINAGYAPGYGQKEYFALAELAAKYGVGTFTHVRYASIIEPQGSFEAVKELIANSALTGAHMHLCHINSTSLTDIHATLDLVDKARKKGIKVTVEAYPYGAANTVVGAAMFSGSDWRERMHSSANNFQLGKKRMTEEELSSYQKDKPGTMITWHFLDEDKPEDLALLDASITHPDVMIASDSVFWSYFDENGDVKTYAGEQWPLPDKVFSHPRSSGTFAKILRSYVRERKLLGLSEAIKKMTLMPAQVLEEFVPQMKKKGRVQVGMDADIVVFDPAKISDRATHENANQVAVGVSAVLVNGEFVLRGGSLVLEADSGRAVRREVSK
ncbi:amidohydrolase family protein [Rubritalea marina]|uniref:amidohydrolase family protein n=1 Tax=Rubritalea marina TaxID=361055 RepID=UPI00036579B1|nr:amidohydrolase family protein [Rubritalea marina]